MKNVLLTGVAGFVGSRLAISLLKKGYAVTGIDNLKTGYIANIPRDVVFINGDCAELATYENSQLNEVDFDFIVHVAGQSSGEVSFDDPCLDLSDNCLSTLRLLEFARRNSCKKFIYASTMSVYGNVGSDLIDESHSTQPLSMYAVGKLASENYLRLFERYGIDSVSLRLFNIYGPGQNMSNLRQGMASIYIAQAIELGKIEVKGRPDRFRDLVFIDDVVRVIDEFMERDFEGSEVYNVCTGVKTKVAGLVDLIKRTLGDESLPVSFIKGTPGDQFGIVGDNTKLRSYLGDIEFTDLDVGISKFISSLGVIQKN